MPLRDFFPAHSRYIINAEELNSSAHLTLLSLSRSHPAALSHRTCVFFSGFYKSLVDLIRYRLKMSMFWMRVCVCACAHSRVHLCIHRTSVVKTELGTECPTAPDSSQGRPCMTTCITADVREMISNQPKNCFHVYRSGFSVFSPALHVP